MGTIPEHSSPVRSGALPAFSPSKLGAPPPPAQGGGGSYSKPPLSARSQALKRVEELEAGGLHHTIPPLSQLNLSRRCVPVDYPLCAVYPLCTAANPLNVSSCEVRSSQALKRVGRVSAKALAGGGACASANFHDGLISRSIQVLQWWRWWRWPRRPLHSSQRGRRSQRGAQGGYPGQAAHRSPRRARLTRGCARGS